MNDNKEKILPSAILINGAKQLNQVQYFYQS